MEMPQPGEAHRKLEKLVGSWSGSEKIYPSPFDKDGGTATARIENRAALGGFIVVQDYEQQRNGRVNYSGHGVFWYDATANQYCMTWFDSMGFPPSVYRGKFDGDVLTLHNSEPQAMSRATFNLSRPGHYAFKMEVSTDGSEWFPFMEGDYQKG